MNAGEAGGREVGVLGPAAGRVGTRRVGARDVVDSDGGSGGPGAFGGSGDAPGDGDGGVGEPAAPDGPPEVPSTRRRGRLRRRWRSWSRWKRVTVILLLLVSLPLVPIGAAALALRLEYAGDPSDQARSRGRDAIWLGHAWVDGRKGQAELAVLAQRLRGTGIHDLYVHAGPLEHDGTLPATAHPGARQLVEAVHRELPGVRVQAWLGDIVSHGGPGLNLDRPRVREAITASAAQVLDAGFEGVHFDLEPVWSGDEDFLTLLTATHELTRARGVPLSVAAAQIDPLPSLHNISKAVRDHPKWWSQRYFGQVARRVEQIAVMSYDTAMPLESLYGGYVAQQTALALEATPARVDVLMGLPAYYANSWGHHGSAETVAAAVRGVRLGLTRTDLHRPGFGVALYVDFAATDTDWASYRRDWCRPDR
ncbi:hypothetical protein ACFZBU_15265 [Embleya sp. NPDC008237]|uniref:hypothetical protein n=1 Tax=Embleya sp. NPDC008237 TaxID=3363978 RepID=UPI0036EAFD63